MGSDGRVYAWGANDSGQLGNGSLSASGVPVQTAMGAIPAGASVSRISIGDRFMTAQTVDRKWYGWGANAAARIGQADTVISSATPVAIAR